MGYPPYLVRRTIHTVGMSSYYGNDCRMYWTGFSTSPDTQDDCLPLDLKLLFGLDIKGGTVLTGKAFY